MKGFTGFEPLWMNMEPEWKGWEPLKHPMGRSLILRKAFWTSSVNHLTAWREEQHENKKAPGDYQLYTLWMHAQASSWDLSPLQTKNNFFSKTLYDDKQAYGDFETHGTNNPAKTQFPLCS